MESDLSVLGLKWSLFRLRPSWWLEVLTHGHLKNYGDDFPFFSGTHTVTYCDYGGVEVDLVYYFFVNPESGFGYAVNGGEASLN